MPPLRPGGKSILLWCTCNTAKAHAKGYHAYPDLNSELWVHSPCDKPTRMVYERISFMRQPKGAVALLSVRSRPDGISEVTYRTTPGVKATVLVVHPYDRRPHAMGVNPNDILLSTWKRLDECVELIKTTYPDNDLMIASVENAKAKARAFAEVLAEMMVPFFDNADDIVREAMRRYKAKSTGDETYETPGLGFKSLEAMDPMPKAETMAAAAKTKPLPVFDEKLTETIRRARDMGMFTAEQLARSYDTTADHIKSL